MKDCKFHDTYAYFACETCNCLVCPSCIMSHTNHVIDLIEIMKENCNLQLKDRADFISQAYNRVSKLHCILEEGIKIKKKNLDDYYESRIESLKREHEAARKKLDEVIKSLEIPEMLTFEIYDPVKKTVLDIKNWAKSYSEILKIQIDDENFLAVRENLKTDDFSRRKSFLERYFEKRTGAHYKELIDSILICFPEITINRPLDIVIEPNPDIRAKANKRFTQKFREYYGKSIETNCEYFYEKDTLVEKINKTVNLTSYSLEEKRDIMWNFEELYDFPLNIKLQLGHDINFLRPRADDIIVFDLHIHNKSHSSTNFQLELISIIKNLKIMQSFSLFVESLEFEVFFANLGSAFQFTRKLNKFFLQSLYHLNKVHVSDFLSKMAEFLKLSSLQLRICLEEPEVIQSLESVISENKYNLKTLELVNPFTANIGLPMMIFNIFPYLYPNCKVNNLAIDLKICLTELLVKELSRVVMWNPIVQFSLTFTLSDQNTNEFFEPLWSALEMKEHLHSILIENNNSYNNYAYADYNLPMLLNALKKKNLARLALRMHNGNTGDISKDINIQTYLLASGSFFTSLRILKLNFGETNIEKAFEYYLKLFQSCKKLDYSKIKVFGQIKDLHSLINTFEKYHPKCAESRLELPNTIVDIDEQAKNIHKYFKKITFEDDKNYLSLVISDINALKSIENKV